MRLLLDTTVLIDVLRARPAVERIRAHRAEGDVMGTTAINVDEVVRGLHNYEVPLARSLFAWLRIVPLGYREGWRAGWWRREFAQQGLTLSQPDCLLAAAASFADARLVTGNPRHFPMTEIGVEHWPVGQ